MIDARNVEKGELALADGRNVLLVGSSYSACPIFFALKRRGFHVAVCGKYENDPCHQYADQSFFSDYSCADDLQKLVEANEFEFLVPSCNDYAYMSCAEVAEKFGFPGYDRLDVATALHTKIRFRDAAKAIGLPVPVYRLAREGEALNIDDLPMPILVKPNDAFSGRGITRLERPNKVPQAIGIARRASRDGGVVVEQFVEGGLYSHSAFVQDGRVLHDYFVDEFCTVYPYQVNCSNHPSRLSDDIRNGVRDAMNTLVAGLGLNDGLLHTQFIADGSKFWIIEPMRRCPGDLYGDLITRSTGHDYTDLFVRPYLNERLPETLPASAERLFGRHTISVADPVAYASFSQTMPTRKVDSVTLKLSGERLHAAPFDKVAILFAEFEDPNEMWRLTPRMNDFIQIQSYDNGNGNAN